MSGVGFDTVQVESWPESSPTTVLARQASSGMALGTTFVDVTSATLDKRQCRIVFLCWAGLRRHGNDLATGE